MFNIIQHYLWIRCDVYSDPYMHEQGVKKKFGHHMYSGKDAGLEGGKLILKHTEYRYHILFKSVRQKSGCINLIGQIIYALQWTKPHQFLALS